MARDRSRRRRRRAVRRGGRSSRGKSADFVLIRAPEGSTLAAVLSLAESVEDKLGAVFTLAREESMPEVRMAGTVV